MGSCLCKEKAQVCAAASPNDSSLSSTMSEVVATIAKQPRNMRPETVEELILQMIHYIGSFQEAGENETPAPLLKINLLADSEDGWCSVVMALVRTIPLHDPLSPSALAIIFDDCPLPARDTVIGFTRSLDLTRSRCAEAYKDEESIRQERNMLVMLGCVAEKFAGPQSTEILTQTLLEYVVTFLIDERNPSLVLHSLITLEKFSRTAENKAIIEKDFASRFLHPLLPLELHHDSVSLEWRQVGFCARWALDNIFIFPGRRFSYETVINVDIQAILNTKDVSEYLKISPDGLEARCDSHSFESVRGTFQIDSGCWYYEAEVITAGVMQIGWATKKAAFHNHDGYGVGDDSFSLAYDGCRRLLWHKAEATPDTSIQSWKPGDILGCLIDVDRKEAIFSLNGQRMPVCTEIFANSSEGFFAAASFMAHQQCRFNFGSREFRFTPTDREFRTMNDCGKLSSEQKKIIPRPIVLKKIKMKNHSIERRCNVCFDEEGCYGIDPCAHGVFCLHCVKLLTTCPMCRCNVQDFYIVVL